MKCCSVVLMSAVACVMFAAGVVFNPMGTKAAQEKTAAQGPIYAQLSSMVTQKPKGSDPSLVSMENDDALSGLDHSEKDKIVVKTSGVYFVMAAAQIAKDSGNQDGYVDLWIQQNGKDVDNSGTRQAVKDAKFTTVLVCQGIAECKAGDVFSAVISASSPGTGLGIYAIKPKGEATIPSIIFSMYKIN